MIAADIVSWALILVGSFLLMAGAFGLLRLPDFYARSHAGGVTDTGGTMFIIAGLAVQAGLSLVAVKLALIFVFLFFTSPTSSHALVHAAFTSGLKPLLDHDKTGEAPDAEAGP